MDIFKKKLPGGNPVEYSSSLENGCSSLIITWSNDMLILMLLLTLFGEIINRLFA